jgi:hypothetical protein
MTALLNSAMRSSMAMSSLVLAKIRFYEQKQFPDGLKSGKNNPNGIKLPSFI